MSLLDHYAAYRKAYDGLPAGGQIMPYNWSNLPSPIGGTWLPYSQMLDEFARELANGINAFSDNVRRLRAWSEIVPELTNEQKLEVTREFIDPLATSALIFPYAVKARFAFAVAHLSHQANRINDPDWSDDMSFDTKINFNTADRHGSSWREYNKFKSAAEAIDTRRYRAATHDFRNAYNHRFSPRVVIGITNIVKRRVADLDKEATVASDGRKAVIYSFGGLQPLDLTRVAGLLEKERDQCYLAFGRFQKLVTEQTNAISKLLIEQA